VKGALHNDWVIRGESVREAGAQRLVPDAGKMSWWLLGGKKSEHWIDHRLGPSDVMSAREREDPVRSPTSTVTYLYSTYLGRMF
jgi:hypothetical protein